MSSILWPDKITPVVNPKNVLLRQDEQHRIMSMEMLAKLPPMARGGESVTLGNSARIGDGAALLAIASEDYVKRHNVKPGITGLAQINGYRGETSNPEDMKIRIDFDLKYIETWSLFLDLKIIAKTLLHIISEYKK